MTNTSIFPSYQRIVNRIPLAFSRRSFRSCEKYIIILVFLTFGLVCFGTLFFLPEFRNSATRSESVYKVYDQIKRAGPELLIPPPPLENSREAPKLLRHEMDTNEGEDPHLIDDREKFKAKIEQDAELKVLERPDIGRFYRKTSTPSNSLKQGNAYEPGIITVPPAISDHYPLVTNGEDSDLIARERRSKIKEAEEMKMLSRIKFREKLELSNLSFQDACAVKGN
ncbi:hypothetical protein HHI36_011931 [Cryptolaemus montrouzieri]|uniref:Uncharacterized protein n=1 Tax=Cryptolaemus montrouzieri TaxID=559131 RepID=A0ABD2ND47_9CUCU